MTVLRSGAASDVGRVRTVNQDLPLERPNLFAVADGMGGHVGGEVAARVAVETLDQAFERAPTVDGLREAFSEANAAIWHESQANADLRGMGTTLTAVALVGGTEGRDVLALANVGDSRAYIFSAGELIQVTDDHSLAEERMRQGEMTEQEAAVHPQRHILTRALGVSDQVDTDMWELELRTGDRVLLCSDGLTNEMGSDEMAAILREVDDPGEAAQRLVEAANQHGGADNITVVVVDVQVGEPGDANSSRVTPLGLGLAGSAQPMTAAVAVVEPEPAAPTTGVRTGVRAPFTAARPVTAVRPHGRRPRGRVRPDTGPGRPAGVWRRAGDVGRVRTSQRRILHGCRRPRCPWPARRPGSLRRPPTGAMRSQREGKAGEHGGGAWGSRAASHPG